MDANTACFIFFAFLFAGYLVLEGFDYGVGTLLPFLGRTDGERQAIVDTLAPVWEGNEVWLIAAGAVLFAGFPVAYAALFSGLYLGLLLVLVPLILRGVAFEFRDKDTSLSWRRFWDWAVFGGSVLPAFVWGVAVAGLAGGLPLDGQAQFAGGITDALGVYPLAGGVLFVCVFAAQGAAYLTLRLDERLLPRVRAYGLAAGWYALPATAVFAGLTLVYTDLASRPAAVGALAAAAACLALGRRSMARRRYGRSFLLSSAAVLLLSAAVFAGLFPRLAVSSLNAAWSLTIYNAAANQLTLGIMVAVLSVALPVVMAFEAWKYSIFFGQRVKVADEPRRQLWRRLAGRLAATAAEGRQLAAVIERLLGRLR